MLFGSNLVKLREQSICIYQCSVHIWWKLLFPMKKRFTYYKYLYICTPVHVSYSGIKLRKWIQYHMNNKTTSVQLQSTQTLLHVQKCVHVIRRSKSSKQTRTCSSYLTQLIKTRTLDWDQKWMDKAIFCVVYILHKAVHCQIFQSVTLNWAKRSPFLSKPLKRKTSLMVYCNIRKMLHDIIRIVAIIYYQIL